MSNKYKTIYLFGIALLVLNCAGSIPSMQEPVEGKNLLIGSVIFENSGYQNRNEIFFSNIEVAIIGYYVENGKEKLFGKWTYTDENGYFFVPNVPDGKYALKGIRVNLAGQAYLTIVNEFRSMVDNYKVQPQETIAFSGTYFNIRPSNRIVNLKHNYFTIFQNSEIRHGAYDMIKQFKASSGDVISRPYIQEYFIEKFPESGWNKYLETELNQIR